MSDRFLHACRAQSITVMNPFQYCSCLPDCSNVLQQLFQLCFQVIR